MLIQLEKTSRPATGARPPVGSHMRGGGVPRNLNSFPSGASPIAQAALDVIAVAVVALLLVATGIGIAASLFFLVFCSF